MKNKTRKKIIEQYEKEMKRLRKVYKVVDDYCYKDKDPKESMKRIIKILYNVEGE